MAKGLGNIMKQAQQMQARIARVQQELETKEIVAMAGGGMVTARVNGKQELLSLTIEKDVVDPEDIEMLQDLVLAAVNEAIKQSQLPALFNHCQNKENQARRVAWMWVF